MAGHGRAWQRQARPWQGMAGHGRAWQRQARPWQGMAGHGMAVTSNIIDYFAKYLILLARITW